METTSNSPYRVTPYRVFLAYLLLTFYCFGAGMMNEFVEYLSYADLGQYVSPAQFARWHQATSHNVLLFLVLPILLGNIALLALFFNRPASVPKWTLWVALTCALTAWASTILFQVPIEQQFDQGHFSPALMARLWQTDWIRKTAFFVEIGVVIFMAVCFLRSVNKRPSVSNADLVTQ
ncbi:hypothetical protein [Spirosoma utsteinense]|uniref:DUF1772 domain-containing protein n=1 Tax=Spirosoma utsteinense TaxID=2585773 RepID=A0ABR6W5C2_9BACT|nr:hypothetical protein [Spirosoma utsteinense]MBC3785653.1 hypothetical protein [Spirosoma utsteinense]MBC3791804.1 hypothetical protein [Spirosoma utsteinense]